MGLHIFQYLREKFAVCLLFDGFDDRRMGGRRCTHHVAADQLDQQLFQIETDQLFSGETGAFGQEQFFLIGIVHPSVEDILRFLDDLRQQQPFRFADLQHLFLEKGHHGGVAGEGHDHQIRCDQSVGIHVMKFVGPVEDDIPLLQSMELLTGQHIHFTLVNAQKFPEIMGFSWKREITHVFKIMNGIDLVNGQNVLQIDTFVTHTSPSPFAKQTDCANLSSYLKTL